MNQTEVVGVVIGTMRPYLPVCLVCLLLSPWNAWAADGTVAVSSQLRQVSDHPLFSLEYTGPYPSRESLTQDILPLVSPQVMCTTFATYPVSPPGAWLGRNYDFHHHPALLLVTRPADGYASVSLVDLGFLGYLDSEAVWKDPGRLRYAPYAPTDGMNEQGLSAAVMALPKTELVRAPEKSSALSLEVLRIILDHARTTEDAIRLLSQQTVAFPGMPVHYLIADAAGHSAVVEYVDGRMRVIRNSRSWQAATNFQLFQSEKQVQAHRAHYQKTGRTEQDPGDSYRRYLAVEEALGNTAEPVSQARAFRVLESVAVNSAEALPDISGKRIWEQGQFGTQWSAVYDMSRRTVTLAMGANFQQLYQMSLGASPPFILIPPAP